MLALHSTLIVDMANFLANNEVMKVANVAQLKDHLSRYLASVEAGEEVEVRKRNVPIARLVPIKASTTNRTVLGSGRGTARILGSLTDPLIPEDDWEMHRDDREDPA